MCVAFLEDEILSYVFSNDLDRDFISHDELSSFRGSLRRAIFRHAGGSPHYSSVYFEGIRDDITHCQDGVVVRTPDGFKFVGRRDGGAAERVGHRFEDPVMREALKTALSSLSARGY